MHVDPITSCLENSTGVSNHEFAESKPNLCKNASGRIQRHHRKSTDDENGFRGAVADIRQSKERRTGDQGFVRRSFVLMPEVNIDG